MQSTGTTTLDPIKFEVIRSALTATTEEIAAALRRSAYSTNVKTRQDFSCAFLDSELRVVAQAFTQPVHLGSFVELIPRAVRSYGVENMGPGDMILVNDPHSGGTHLNDITLIAPVYYPGAPGSNDANSFLVRVDGRENRRAPESWLPRSRRPLPTA